MALSLLFNASLVIQTHLVFAIGAFVLGAVQLLTRKGTNLHRRIGRVWVFMMGVICVSSFWIKEVMPQSAFFGYSPIHVLSVFVLVQLCLGIYFIRRGNIEGHKRCMTYTYLGGLVIAGAFTFYPGRLLYRAVIEPFFAS